MVGQGKVGRSGPGSGPVGLGVGLGAGGTRSGSAGTGCGAPGSGAPGSGVGGIGVVIRHLQGRTRDNLDNLAAPLLSQPVRPAAAGAPVTAATSTSHDRSVHDTGKDGQDDDESRAEPLCLAAAGAPTCHRLRSNMTFDARGDERTRRHAGSAERDSHLGVYAGRRPIWAAIGGSGTPPARRTRASPRPPEASRRGA